MGARAGGGKEEQGQREVVSLVWNLLCSKGEAPQTSAADSNLELETRRQERPMLPLLGLTWGRVRAAAAEGTPVAGVAGCGRVLAGRRATKAALWAPFEWSHVKKG